MTAPTPDEQAQASQLHKFAAELRGKFLNGTTWIEPLLSEIITSYFCKRKRRNRLFFFEIAGEMTLERKGQLLVKVLKHEFPAMLRNYPLIEQQLGHLRSFRNLLAHAHIDTSRVALQKRTDRDDVTFVRYRKGKTERYRVTRRDAQRRAKDANELRHALGDIERFVSDEAADVA